MSLRHRRRQIENLLEKLGGAAERRRGPEPDFTRLHDVELKRAGELLRRKLVSEGATLRTGAGGHHPTSPMPACQCAICDGPVAPLTDRDEKELAVYLAMAVHGREAVLPNRREREADDEQEPEDEEP